MNNLKNLIRMILTPGADKSVRTIAKIAAENKETWKDSVNQLEIYKAEYSAGLKPFKEEEFMNDILELMFEAMQAGIETGVDLTGLLYNTGQPFSTFGCNRIITADDAIALAKACLMSNPSLGFEVKDLDEIKKMCGDVSGDTDQIKMNLNCYLAGLGRGVWEYSIDYGKPGYEGI